MKLKKLVAVIMAVILTTATIPYNVMAGDAGALLDVLSGAAIPSEIEELEPLVDDARARSRSSQPELSEEELVEISNDLVESELSYTALEDDEKVILQQYAGLRMETMEELADEGNSIAESTDYALIMQRLEISYDDAEQMVQAFGGIERAEAASERIVELQYDYAAINGDYWPEIVELLVQGYDPDGIIAAFTVAGALGIAIDDVIGEKTPSPSEERSDKLPEELKEKLGGSSGIEESASPDEGQDPEEESPEEPAESDEGTDEIDEDESELSNETDGDYLENSYEDILSTYSVETDEDIAAAEDEEIGDDPDEVEDGEVSDESTEVNDEPTDVGDEPTSSEPVVGEEELEELRNEARLSRLSVRYNLDQELIEQYAESEGLTIDEIYSSVAEFTSTELIAPTAAEFGDENFSTDKEFPVAAYTFNGNSNEKVNVSSGALVYEDHIATIPGVNGLDLNLTLRYDSDEANNLDSFKGVEEFYLGRIRLEERYYFDDQRFDDEYWDTVWYYDDPVTTHPFSSKPRRV